ncbi:unnamed protein product [Caenorhabditis auriculariae]|uniref:Uncharacterized protein n=1 Tax=Caenorhabditis auriculariae TaxID=2777116 RepID=A0A8S1GWP7_9PELO|nr:unnamed protein product [Caenorhabditis auriculariae]
MGLAHSATSQRRCRGELRDPEDECRLAHYRVTLDVVVRFFGSIAVVGVLAGIYFSGRPSHIIPEEHMDFVLEARKTFRFFANGNGSIYTPTANGPVMVDPWLENMVIDTVERYAFGTTQTNYCHLRNASVQEWGTSLFRASQLFVSVQVPFRMAILVLCHIQILQMLIFAKAFYNENQSVASLSLAVTHKDGYVTGASPLIITDQDRTSANRLGAPTPLKRYSGGVCYASLGRIFGAIVVFVSYPVMANDVDSYVREIYCDTFVLPNVPLAQMSTLGVMAANFAWDLHCSRRLHFVFTSTADEEPIHWTGAKDPPIRSALNIHIAAVEDVLKIPPILFSSVSDEF